MIVDKLGVYCKYNFFLNLALGGKNSGKDYNFVTIIFGIFFSKLSLIDILQHFG